MKIRNIPGDEFAAVTVLVALAIALALIAGP
jgi:hypothetical protein